MTKLTNNINKWIKRTGSRLNTLCRSLLYFRRKQTRPVRLKTRKRNIIAELNKNLFIGRRYGNRKRLWSKGFVLPTITMILLVFSLVAASILARSSQNTQATIGNRQSQATYNLATPAVERAKSKIEYLFKKDDRFNSNLIPTETALEKGMKDLAIYTLPNETRIDINKDNELDNAWAYDTDIDGDGVDETVIYSILLRNSREIGTNSYQSMDGTFKYNPPTSTKLKDKVYTNTTPPSDSDKASLLMTRTGPLTLLNGTSIANCTTPGSPDAEDTGWYQINTATFRKNIQVNAVVVKKNDALRTISSVEFQQDRQMDKGNKWGLWFRYDLEVFPGPSFNWNGAMHTEGNIIWGDSAGGEGINAYLISSPASCLYTEDASEITLAQNENNNGQITFQGQVVSANITLDKYGTEISKVDLFLGAGEAPSVNTSTDKVVLKKETDSVIDNQQTASPYQLSLDPIALFTEDNSVSRNPNDQTNTSARDINWQDNPLNQRMFNQFSPKPYVDDTYRADDRWGPKPAYTNIIKVDSTKNGENITGPYLNDLTRENPPNEFPDKVGLDGYWERRARFEGLRLIVGQRLELGNAFGWKGNNDALYPPNSTTLTNLDRQRRTIRDNLAAVQSTLIYHYANDKDFPVATLATTVHPATTQILARSTEFNLLPYKYQNVNLAVPDPAAKDHVNTNFLTGDGTNGWEFNPPGNATTQSAFAAMIEDNTNPLRIALNNLALFAGDSQGGFPPAQNGPLATNPVTHPYPDYTMWGDFSELRKILIHPDGSPKTTLNYDDLSIAERTTVQTAASTVGLLAYNLDNLKRQYEGLRADTTTDGMMGLGKYFWMLIDGDTTNGEVNQLISPKVPFPKGYNRTTGAAAFYSQFTPDQYLEAFSNLSSLPTNKNELIERARLLAAYIQIERDRLLGFKDSIGGLLKDLPNTTSTWKTSNTGSVFSGTEVIGANTNFNTLCDFNVFGNQTNTTLPSYTYQVGLSVTFCSQAITPKYPSLYFIFPKYNHNYLGKMPGSQNAYGTTDDQPDDPTTGEEYIKDTYLATDRDISDVFNVIKPIAIPNPSGIVSDNTYDADNSLAEIALQPRDLDNWKLPKTISSTNLLPTDTSGDRVNQIVYRDSSNVTSFIRIPFLDKAFYNGRQLMQVRSLEVDLKMLKDNSIGNPSDTWLTKNGIIYAFREDAIREDAIARPTGQNFADCNTEAKLFSDSCRMKVNTPQDPPNNELTGVSTKPVDFYPDPDRRPYGFRLTNGADISRSDTDKGFSFVSDNPIYVQGDLNIHQDSSGKLLEEFTETLEDNWSNFYTRKTLDSKFARPASDRWRPVEILGDSLTVISNNFCDGVVEDGLSNTNTNCFSNSLSSYDNSTLANLNKKLRRENPADSNSPVLMDRNLVIRETNGTIFNEYRNIKRGKFNTAAVNTRMNAIFISGLVPSRSGQSYGGFHNFPRFIENWSGERLYIAGAFVQLNFSTYDTAPFDQETWEPGNNPDLEGEYIPYYSPPDRRWGYDVALQYSPAGPVAARFVSSGSPRNEFYKQLSADDPYTKLLRCATVNGKKIDPNATDCPL